MTLDITRLKVSHDPTNQLNLTPSMFIRDQALDITAGIQGIVDLLRDAIVEAITGLVGGLLPDLAQFFVNLDDFFGVDFNLLEFDLFGAIGDFISGRLLPSGLFDFLDQSELVQKILDILSGIFENILPGDGTWERAIEALNRLRELGQDALSKAEQALRDLLQLLSDLWNNPVKVIANLLASMIPGLDASKIISGEFAQEMVTGLVSALSDLGNQIGQLLDKLWNSPWEVISNLLASMIPGLDASKIISGQFAQEMIDGLIDALSDLGGQISKLLSDLWNNPWEVIANLLASMIPGLDASKIISGQFAKEMVDGLIESLSDLAGQIGDLLSSLWNNPWEVIANLIASMIPGLDASKIISGKFAQSMLNITSIAASIITGVLNALQIPGLDASKITTGQFAQSMVNITSIAASIITGTLAAARIPGLDASKIITGQFAQSMVNGLVTSLNDLVNLIDGIAEALFPTGGIGRPVADAIDSILGILGVGRQAQSSADNANIGVEAIRAELAGGNYDEFDYPLAATLPADKYAVSYYGAGGATLGPSGTGRLVFKPAQFGLREIVYRRSDMSLAGDIATLTLTFSKPPHDDAIVDSFAYLAWRMSAVDKACVRVKVGAKAVWVQSLNAAGTAFEHVGSGGLATPAPVQAGDTIEARFSLTQVHIYHNRAFVATVNATGVVDANHRQLGFGVYVPAYTWFSGHPSPEFAGVTWKPTLETRLQALSTGR